NHPNLSKISLEDAFYLLIHDAIKMIVAVTNRGSISYIVKQTNMIALLPKSYFVRLSKEIEEHIRPLVMKIAEEQGLLSPCQQKA
ncbi:MAG: hypothetical protein IJ733_07130, partial [Lachnospiraceae bacterium]|nr:hypothetical protein [Lachnospiraceae bacterium]